MVFRCCAEVVRIRALCAHIRDRRSVASFGKQPGAVTEFFPSPGR